MFDIDFENWLRFRQLLATGLQHTTHLRIEILVARNHTGRRVDQSATDVHRLHALTQNILNLVEQSLVLFIELFLSFIVALFWHIERLARDVNQRLSFILNQTFGEPGIDSIRQQ